MNKIELLQEKYDAKKNDMSKEELLEFNEHLFKSFLSDKKANDDVFWAYSEITDRVIEDLKDKNAQLITDNRLGNKGNKGYIDNLELELKFHKRLNNEKHVELNRVIEDYGRLEKEVSFFKQLSYANGLKFNGAKKDINKLEKDLVKERSLSNQLSFQAELHDRDIAFFQQAIKEQRDIVIDEVIKLLDKEVGNFNTFTEWMSVKKLVVLKNKIKEMGNK